MELDSIKLRFGIIGNDSALNRALDVALKVASTDLSVIITGESGVGKEFFPQIIHQNSPRKHNNYIAVNCGAIPEGTIDSELFGHEKGSFTGASESRKGYFEIASGGTIFLDEVAELPLTTQVRLLRVLQSGEFMKVGSSKVQKTDVRVVAATNINLVQAIEQGKFREDLYYRLNTVPIVVPALRYREGDVFMLFRKFVTDIASQYRMPSISLTSSARALLESYSWPGNIRQLKNVAEQISVIEESRSIDETTLAKYLPEASTSPALLSAAQRGNRDRGQSFDGEFVYDREMFYSVLRDLRLEISEIKRMLVDMGAPLRGGADVAPSSHPVAFGQLPQFASLPQLTSPIVEAVEAATEVVDAVESMPLTKEIVQREAIISALRRNNGKRREAAKELFISERTLYRKMKDLSIDENEYKK